MESRIKNLKNYEEFRKVFDIFKYYPFFEAWTEDVSFPRTNPAVNNVDTRKFLSLKLEKH